MLQEPGSLDFTIPGLRTLFSDIFNLKQTLTEHAYNKDL